MSLDPKRTLTLLEQAQLDYYQARYTPGAVDGWIWLDRKARLLYGDSYVSNSYSVSFLQDVNRYQYGDAVRTYLLPLIQARLGSDDPSFQFSRGSGQQLLDLQGRLTDVLRQLNEAVPQSSVWKQLYGKKLILQDQIDQLQGKARPTDCVGWLMLAQDGSDEVKAYFGTEIRKCQALRDSGVDLNSRPVDFTTNNPGPWSWNDVLLVLALGLGVVVAVRLAKS